MHAVLSSLGKTLQIFLEETLPSCDANWWERCVLDRLSIQQRRLVDERQVKTLEGLDLAGLLRVLDQNWYDINSSRVLPGEARNWLKEAQSIRNRWAHLPPDGLRPEDAYRDVDTLLRLMSVLGAEPQTLATAHDARTTALSAISGRKSPQVLDSSPTVSGGPIAKGAVVRLKARPDKTGAVIEVLTGGGETRYQVFHDGIVSTYYESQIDLALVAPAREKVSPDALHAALTALQLRHPSTSHLYSLFASRINFVPYQFRPVLKLIQADRPRILVADEVGVGKTIEAGLILKELQARRELRSILVICPKPLVSERKWLEEMKRFDEQFTHLDGDSLRYCIEETHLDGVWPAQYSRAIVPYSLFDENMLMGQQKGRQRRHGLLDLDPPPVFDLVIVDEAHHIRNTETWAYRTVRYFCDNAEAVVLLSATPIQLGDNDLFNLLHLMRPDVIASRRDFEQMAEPNPHINAAIEVARTAQEGWRASARAAMQRASNTAWGRGVLTANPRLQQAHDLLASEDGDTSARLSLIRLLEELYTFSPFINRTRRRDIGNFTTRKPETVSVDFTPEQADLHGALLELIARILAHRHGDQHLQFMMTTVRRQVASCVFGLAPYLESILHGHLTRMEMSESDGEDDVVVAGEALQEFRIDVDALVRKARALSGEDPKFDAFVNVIRNKQKLPNNKLLVFSTFRHTLAYLIRRLGEESIRIGLIHGDVPEEDRRELRNRFSRPKEDPQAVDVLLSSEVGCEGLDYQFCDGMVNYDLPWNPMRVEQRIGRIDRYGQKSETVAIYNFITPGTVDAEIYERCLLRIGVFRQALGGSEEILGRLTQEIRDIAENLQLNPAEQATRLQQVADNEIRVIQEQAILEEEQAKLFGLSLPKRDDDMVKQASSFWLTPSMLANLVERYLGAIEGDKPKRPLGRKAITTLQLGQEMRDKLISDFSTFAQTGAAAKAWERWLKGSDPYLKLTFDPVAADEQRDVVFITPTHPLAKQAARSVEPATPLLSNLSAQSNDAPPGRYPYAVYRWRKLGLKEDFAFQPVCTGQLESTRVLELLEAAGPGDVSTGDISSAEESTLEDQHYILWANERAKHIELVSQVAESRLASLNTTHTARLSLLEEQRDGASDARIRRMRESQIETAKRDYERRADELRKAPEQADMIAEVVAVGVLTVVGISNGN